MDVNVKDEFTVSHYFHRLVGPSIEQSRDGCVYAAAAKLIEYDIRNSYYRANPELNIPDGHMVNHVEWEKEVQKKVRQRPSPLRVLTWARVNGVPLYNGMRHKIDVFGLINRDSISMELNSRPLLGVFGVCSRFRPFGETPYIGGGTPMGNPPATHAVVLVGKAADKDGVQYYMYQNSHATPEEESRSMYGKQVSLVRADLIIEAYMCESAPTSPLVTDRADLWNRVRARGFRRDEDRVRHPESSVDVAWSRVHMPL